MLSRFFSSTAVTALSCPRWAPVLLRCRGSPRKLLGQRRGVAEQLDDGLPLIDQDIHQVVGVEDQGVHLRAARREDGADFPYVFEQFSQCVVAGVESPRQPGDPVECRTQFWGDLVDRGRQGVQRLVECARVGTGNVGGQVTDGVGDRDGEDVREVGMISDGCNRARPADSSVNIRWPSRDPVRM